jgi:PAS domain S-box-containing protein
MTSRLRNVLKQANSSVQTTKILENVSEGIYILDRDWHFVYANQRAASDLRTNLKNLSGEHIWEKFPQYKGTDLESKYREVMTSRRSFVFEWYDRNAVKRYHIRVFPSEDGISVYLQDITEYTQFEESLIESNRRYRSLVEMTSDFIWEVNQAGVYTYASPKIYDILGYRPEEILGKTPFELMPPKEARRMKKIFEEYTIHQKPINSLENTNKHKDGHLVVLETSGVIILDSQGKVIGYRGIDRDITERKQAEKSLKESEERFSRVFHSSESTFVITTLKEGTIIDANEAFITSTGYSREELIGHKTTEIGLWGNPEQRGELIRRLKAEGKVHRQDVEVRTKNGRLMNTLFSMEIIHFDGKDYALTTAIDITERKRVEEALAMAKDELEIKVKERTRQLAQSEEEYRRLVDNANEGVSVVQDGVNKFVNKRGLEISGYLREELVDKPFIELVHPDERQSITESIQRFMVGSPVQLNYEFRIVRKNGGVSWLQMNVANTTWAGRPAILTMFTDITDRKNMEEELKAYAHKITQVQEEERKRIAYELHDDTAQYLSILKMQIGALAESGEIQNPKIKEKLHFLEKDAERAFNDVRRFSHELRPTTLEHHGLVGALEQIADDFNKLGQLSVKVYIEGMEPELSEEVKLGFFRIAQESLNNTRKHSKASQANIDLRFSQKRMWMMISDNGEGFDTKQVLKISGSKGSLGLMSMRERADIIGATLKMKSKPGEGTIIRVEVPL